MLELRLLRLVNRELILVLFVRLFDFRLFVLSVFSSSWCLGRAAFFLFWHSLDFSLTFFFLNGIETILVNCDFQSDGKFYNKFEGTATEAKFAPT